MTPRAERRRPEVSGRGLGLALTLALGLALGATAAAPNAAAFAAAPRGGPRVPTIYYKSRNFRIPFNVDAADRPTLSEVRLYCSEDSGYEWKIASRTTPDHPAFSFRAAHDGEYWFAVRTLDVHGNLFPGKDEKVEPSMKVVVDTSPPSLRLEPDGRRGSLASVRWEIKDERLDLKSLVLEYQVEGARDWRQVEITRPGLIGRATWDAGSASPLKVRGSVGDKAGNVAEQLLSLPEGTPENPGVASAEPPAPPPISRVGSGPTFPPADEPQPGAASPASADPFSLPPGFGAPAPSPSPAAPGGEFDPFGGSNAPAPESPGGNPNPNAGPGQPVLIPSPRFPLQYAVEDAGPGGPATVELWVTQDGGRTWIKRAEDPDRQSPFPVDLGGDGIYGLRVVARSESGLGDAPPVMGDPPQMVVEVDGTPPAVQIVRTAVGKKPPQLGKVFIQWQASDPHLGPRPVVISWRPEQLGATWQPVTEPIENTGQFIWNVPASVPSRFRLRIDVVDTAGNRGFAETPEGTPVVIDRNRPRGRIIGLDPSARAGMSGGRALR